MPQLQAGDRILKAELTAGAERLVLPEGPLNAQQQEREHIDEI